MLNTLRGNGFDCLLILVSIKMEHPKPLQVCFNVCIIFAHTGAGGIRVAGREDAGTLYNIYTHYANKKNEFSYKN